MAVMKEWSCLEHGEFERTHPICPAHGCKSKFVTQEFRTAPMIRSGAMKRFDAGIKKSADMMRINNFRTARAGEAAFGGEAAKAAGTELLWGDASKKVLGQNFAQMIAQAARPLEVKNKAGETLRITENNGMREAATEAGITRRSVPRAGEVAVEPSDTKGVTKAKALAA